MVKEFKLMYRQIGGSPPAEGNLPNWSIDEFIGVLEVYMRSMTTCMTQIVSTVRKESGNVDGKLEDKQLMEIRGAFQASADKFSNKVLQEGYGIDQDVFASIMQKFQTEKRVNDCLTALAEEQNRAFKEMGVA
ncbi:hypothetical protein TL16_g09310 [Triparma laevis f. inornata]|nr:hypothetical protein TL16_g09310 [Triparma laevis f. inornata]